MGDDADDIFSAVPMTADERKKYDTVKSKLEGHFIIKRNVIFERAKFNLRFQKENGSVDNFITDLFTLAQHCNHGTLHDEMVRDRIVVGLKDKTLSEKLQLEAYRTLEKAINQARQKEPVRQQQGIIRQEGPSANNVDRVKSTRPRPKDKFKTAFKTSKKVEDRNQACGSCGGKPHERNECPAKDSICNICKRKVHWNKRCKTKTVSEIQSNQDDKEFLFGEIHIDQLDSVNQSSWKADLIFKLMIKL